MELYIWIEIELCGMKINENECSRSVPTRNVPLHRQENQWHGDNDSNDDDSDNK